MLRITLLLVLAALACQAAPGQDNAAIKELYNSVIVGDYEAAVSLSKDLEKENKIESIIITTAKLIVEKQRNVVDYAYYLWKEDAKHIVKHFLPIQFRSIIGQQAVKLIGKRDNMVLKLGVKVDSDGDRVAYGDANHMIGDRMAWKFIPVEDSQLYFLIYNPMTNQYLKLGVATDSDGDHKVYGSSNSDSYAHQFYLIPAASGDEYLFYIFNREYQQALKLSRAVDSDGDRQVFSEHGDVLNDPNAFGWSIKAL